MNEEELQAYREQLRCKFPIIDEHFEDFIKDADRKSVV